MWVLSAKLPGITPYPVSFGCCEFIRWRVLRQAPWGPTGLRPLAIKVVRCFRQLKALPASSLRCRSASPSRQPPISLRTFPAPSHRGRPGGSEVARRGGQASGRPHGGRRERAARLEARSPKRTGHGRGRTAQGGRPYQVNERQEFPAPAVGLMRGHFDGLVVTEDRAVGQQDGHPQHLAGHQRHVRHRPGRAGRAGSAPHGTGAAASPDDLRGRGRR